MPTPQRKQVIMGGVKVSFDEKGEVTNEIEYQQNVQASQVGFRFCLSPRHHYQPRRFLPKNENQKFCTELCLKDCITNYLIPLFAQMADLEWSFIPKPTIDNGALPTLNLEFLEKMAIETALEQTDWKQSNAAPLLGIKPRALNYRIAHHGITHERWVVNIPGKDRVNTGD
jgi:DNA-binding protein Fis